MSNTAEVFDSVVPACLEIIRRAQTGDTRECEFSNNDSTYNSLASSPTVDALEVLSNVFHFFLYTFLEKANSSETISEAKEFDSKPSTNGLLFPLISFPFPKLQVSSFLATHRISLLYNAFEKTKMDSKPHKDATSSKTVVKMCEKTLCVLSNLLQHTVLPNALNGSEASPTNKAFDPSLYNKVLSISSTVVQMYMMHLISSSRPLSDDGNLEFPVVEADVLLALVSLTSSSSELLGNLHLLSLSSSKSASLLPSSTSSASCPSGTSATPDLADLQLRSLDLLIHLLELATQCPFVSFFDLELCQEAAPFLARRYPMHLLPENLPPFPVTFPAALQQADCTAVGPHQKGVRLGAWSTAVRRGCTWLLTARVSVAEKHRALKLLHLSTRLLGNSWLLRSLQTGEGVQRRGGGKDGEEREQVTIRKNQSDAVRVERGDHFFRIMLEVLHIELHMLLLDALRPHWKASIPGPIIKSPPSPPTSEAEKRVKYETSNLDITASNEISIEDERSIEDDSIQEELKTNLSGNDSSNPSLSGGASASSFDPETTLAWVAATEENRRRRERFAEIQEPVPNALPNRQQSNDETEENKSEGASQQTTGQRAEAMLPICFHLLRSCTEVISCLAEKTEGNSGNREEGKKGVHGSNTNYSAANIANISNERQSVGKEDGVSDDVWLVCDEELRERCYEADTLIETPDCSTRELPVLPEKTLEKFYDKIRSSMDDVVGFLKEVQQRKEGDEGQEQGGRGEVTAEGKGIADDLPPINLCILAADTLLDFLGEAPDLKADRGISSVYSFAERLSEIASEGE